MSKKKPRIFLTLKIVGVLLANLIFLELILSWFPPQPVYAIRYSPWGWEHLPNVSFRTGSESQEADGIVTYNSDGFRNKNEFEPDITEDILRIAILGDSQAEGSMVGDDDTSSAVAERKINQVLERGASRLKQRRAEVINAGVYAYEPCQFLRLFLQRVRNYRPDIVYVIHYSKYADNTFCGNQAGRLVFKDFSIHKH